MAFARFMSSALGRGIRIVAGLALVAVGVTLAVTSAGATGPVVGGTALILVGALVFAAGALNVCFIAPLIRAPFRGRDARA